LGRSNPDIALGLNLFRPLLLCLDRFVPRDVGAQAIVWEFVGTIALARPQKHRVLAGD